MKEVIQWEMRTLSGRYGKWETEFTFEKLTKKVCSYCHGISSRIERLPEGCFLTLKNLLMNSIEIKEKETDYLCLKCGRERMKKFDDSRFRINRENVSKIREIEKSL